MVRKLTNEQVDDLIKLKFGRMVTSHHHVQYASNATLGKIFGISASQVRRLYMAKFQKIRDQQLPLLLAVFPLLLLVEEHVDRDEQHGRVFYFD